MNYLKTRADSVATSGIESILFGDNPEPVRRRLVQSLSPTLKKEGGVSQFMPSFVETVVYKAQITYSQKF